MLSFGRDNLCRLFVLILYSIGVSVTKKLLKAHYNNIEGLLKLHHLLKILEKMVPKENMLDIK